MRDNFILHIYTNMKLKITQQFSYLGSSYLSPANGLGGLRATILLFFPKAAAAPALRALKQKGKKEGGLGEGIFALLRLRIERFRFSLIKRNTKQKNFLFLLKEKIAREKIKKCRENFSVLVPPKRSGGGRKRTSLFWILFKESSNIVQKTPPIYTFCEIVRGCLGAKRLGMIFFRNFEGIFEIQNQSAVGNAEVRTNLF